MSHIVVFDHLGIVAPGDVITDIDRNRIESAVTLPFDPKLQQLNAVGGYAKREFGAGIPMSGGRPRALAGFTFYATRDCKKLEWVARVVPNAPGKEITGVINFAIDTTQHGAHSFSLSDTGAAQRPQDSPLDRWGGWTVRGRAAAHFNQDGFFGAAVYGAVFGCRLLWAAVAITP
jgi:hypothetical protein